MSEVHYGQMDWAGERPMVSFDRVLGHPVDEVWEMISTADGLERWLAPAKVDLRIGGVVDIDFGEGGVVGGEIHELVPGELLEYVWRFVGEPDSIIRFELQPISEGTRLKLTHRLLPRDQSVGYGAGWHAHLDQLDSALRGDTEFDWDGRFGELVPEYQKL